MIWSITELFASVVESLIIADCISRYLDFKNNRLNLLKVLLCAGLSTLNVILGEEVLHSEVITVANLVIIMLTYSIIFLRGSIYQKIFAVSINCLMIMAVNTLVLTVFGFIFDANFSELAEMRNSARVILLATTKFLYFICTRFMLQLKKRDEPVLSAKDWLGVLGMFVVTHAIGTIVFEAIWKQDYGEFTLSAFAVGMILINVITYALLRRLSMEYKKRTMIALLELQLSEQKERIATINEMHNEVLQIRHDVRKCLNLAEILIRQGKPEEAAKYLSDISSEKLGTITEFVSLDSGVVSAVINSKLSQCREEGVAIEQIAVEYEECFSEIDISMLLANLFDNAIEACRRTEKRWLSFRMEKQAGYLKILMVNSANGEEAKKNPQLKSTKEDKKNHGFGLKTVRDIAQKYDGMCHTSFDKDTFVADVWLKTH